MHARADRNVLRRARTEARRLLARLEVDDATDGVGDRVEIVIDRTQRARDGG